MAYARGSGVARDVARAGQYFRLAADQDDAQSQFMLGTMYANGAGVPRDDAQAVAWYRRAAEKGLAVAQTNLGARYASGRGTAENPAEAARWFERAARQGDASALFNLGVLYANGSGVAQDAVRAYVLLALAAAKAPGADGARYGGARDTVAAALPPAQLTEAQALAAKGVLPWPPPGP
jgi:TPR repeat protein